MGVKDITEVMKHKEMTVDHSEISEKMTKYMCIMDMVEHHGAFWRRRKL
jgi:hypothetical protein